MTERQPAVTLRAARYTMTAADAYRHIRDTYPRIAPVSLRELKHVYRIDEEFPTPYVLIIGEGIWSVYDTNPFGVRRDLIALYSIREDLR